MNGKEQTYEQLMFAQLFLLLIFTTMNSIGFYMT